MSTSIYKRFLADPSSSLLAENASLHYITTTTSFRGASEVIKHLSSLQRQVKKKDEKFISVIEGQTAIAVEVDTSLQFQTSGGVYAPGIDEDFLTSVTVQFPIMHIVTFDGDGKIMQIRQQWDQGSLIKQLDLIGRSGKNWPIRDSKDQLALIHSCVKSFAASTRDEFDAPKKSRTISSNSPRDPNESLRLFASRDAIDDGEGNQYESFPTKSGGREPHENRIFGATNSRNSDNLYQDSPAKSGLRKPMGNRIFGGDSSSDSGDHAHPFQNSPAKAGLRAPPVNRILGGHDPENQNSPAKAGLREPPVNRILGGHNLPESDDPFQNSPAKAGLREPQRNRLFEREGSEEPQEPEDDGKPKPRVPHIRAHPSKYEHFTFADGSDEKDIPKAIPPFAPSPYSKHESQWSFADFTSPVKVTPSRGMSGHDLYESEAKNAMMNQSGESMASKKSRGTTGGPGENPLSAGGALDNITNTNNRAKDAENDSTSTEKSQSRDPKQGLVDAVRALDINQDRAENDNYQRQQRIHIAGDGMGGRAGSHRNFLTGGDDDQPYRPMIARNENAAQLTRSRLWDQ